jgi:hypothetical protein
LAMSSIYVRLLQAAFGFARGGDPEKRLKTLALGYPDLIATRQEMRAIFPTLPETAFQVRADSANIALRHGVSTTTEILDSDHILRALGLDVDYIDVQPSRGVERQVDLNEPLPESMTAQYDFVIDTGTLEHCFNVGQAFKNVAQAVAVKGVIVQASPLNRYNHGFWNFSPTAYHDYYHDNGFEILYLKGWAGGVADEVIQFDVDLVRGFRGAPENSALLCVCQKTEQRPHKWPTQWKYRS